MGTRFIRKTTFYPFPVYEFNLPTGHSCPGAKDCKISVDRHTGKFTTTGKVFRCYAASAERFPAVRKYRWDNFDAVKRGEPIRVPAKATHVRIHSSGDFFSQVYFDQWLQVCKENPTVQFWAFTKSPQYWVNRMGQIPPNLTLQASKGGHSDHLIDKYKLKYAEVFQDRDKIPAGMEIDTNDVHAMTGKKSFALLDNSKYSKKDGPQ